MTRLSMNGWLDGPDDAPLNDPIRDALDSHRLHPIEQALANADQSVVSSKVLVHPWAIAATSNVKQAVVLAQVAYYVTGRRGTHSIGADPTRGLLNTNTARSARKIAQETGQTEAVVDHVLRALKTAGLIDWKQKIFGGITKRHIWLTDRAQELLRRNHGRPTQNRSIAYRPWLAHYIASLPLKPGVSTATIALVASQLYFWYSRRSADGSRRPLVNPPEPEHGLNEPWFYKRNTELAEELGLRVEKINRSMKALKDSGLVEVAYTRRAGKRTGRIMLVSSAWRTAIDAVSPSQG